MRFQLTIEVRPLSNSGKNRTMEMKENFVAEGMDDAMSITREIISLVSKGHDHLIGYYLKTKLCYENCNEQAIWTKEVVDGNSCEVFNY